jgi:hypothetical protein
VATSIIIGSGGAHNAIQDANTAAGAHSWTQAQMDWMAGQFQSFANDVQKRITSFNAGNPP